MLCLCPEAKPVCVGFVNGAGWGHCAGLAADANFSFTSWFTGDKKAPAAVGFIAGQPLPQSWTEGGDSRGRVCHFNILKSAHLH